MINDTKIKSFFVSFLLFISCCGLINNANASIFETINESYTNVKWTPNEKGLVLINVCIDPTSNLNDLIPIFSPLPRPTLADVISHMQLALMSTWEANSSIRFVGWDFCTSTNTSTKDLNKAIPVYITADPNWESNSPIGKNALFPYSNGTYPRVEVGVFGRTFSRCLSVDWGCDSQYSIHEFGHLIGFVHEMRHPLANPKCTDQNNPTISLDNKNYTINNPYYYDFNSIMAYGPGECVHRDGVRFGTTTLSVTDIQGIQVQFPLVAQNISSSELDFGGMFGYIDIKTLVVNPFTHDMTCPEGFNKQQIFKTAYKLPIYLCSKEHIPGAESKYDFGGIWGYANGQVVPNAVTGKQNCPDTFSQMQISALNGIDYPIYVCYREHADNPPIKFGGTISIIEKKFINNQITYFNQCPIGYQTSQVLGVPGLYVPLSYCFYRQPQQRLDFGGAFGYVDNNPVVNPATNAMSCPDGFTKQQLAGITGNPYPSPLYLCVKPLEEGVQPKYDFGGMWGYVNGIKIANILTGQPSCPANFMDYQISGTPAKDWPIHVCYQEHSDLTKDKLWLGGAMGVVDGNLINNTITQNQSCPKDYFAQLISVAPSADFPIIYCYAIPEDKLIINK